MRSRSSLYPSISAVVHKLPLLKFILLCHCTALPLPHANAPNLIVSRHKHYKEVSVAPTLLYWNHHHHHHYHHHHNQHHDHDQHHHHGPHQHYHHHHRHHHQHPPHHHPHQHYHHQQHSICPICSIVTSSEVSAAPAQVTKPVVQHHHHHHYLPFFLQIFTLLTEQCWIFLTTSLKFNFCTKNIQTGQTLSP